MVVLDASRIEGTLAQTQVPSPSSMCNLFLWSWFSVIHTHNNCGILYVHIDEIPAVIDRVLTLSGIYGIGFGFGFILIVLMFGIFLLAAMLIVMRKKRSEGMCKASLFLIINHIPSYLLFFSN